MSKKRVSKVTAKKTVEIEEVKAVMRDQRSWGVDILTLGQYLQPSKKHLPIQRYYTLEEFAELKEYGLQDSSDLSCWCGDRGRRGMVSAGGGEIIPGVSLCW